MNLLNNIIIDSIMKKSLFILCTLFISVCAFSQPKVHNTSRTKFMLADDISNYDVGDCVGGFFVARDANTGISYIVDILGKKKGRIYLNSGFGSFIPRFFGGKVATAVLQNGMHVVINTAGEIVKSYPEAVRISPRFVDGIAAVRVVHPQTGNRMTVYINESGEQVFTDLTIAGITLTDGDFEVYPLKNGLRKYQDPKTQLFGYVDSSGNITIPAQYKKCHNFSDSLAAVSSGENLVEYWGFIDIKGQYVIRDKFSIEPDDFHEGYAVVTTKDWKKVYVDKTGRAVTSEYDYAARFFNGYAVVNPGSSTDYKMVILDKSFKIVNKLSVSSVFSVYYNEYNNTIVMDDCVYYPNGEIKLTINTSYTCREFVEDIAFFVKEDLSGFFNSKGEVLLRLVRGDF